MSAEGTLVADLFEGMCDQYLARGETRLLKMRCGLGSGYPPLSIEHIANLYNQPADKLKLIANKALLKLPKPELEQVKRYLDDETHKFHQGLNNGQRRALFNLVEMALLLHFARAKAKPSTVPPKPKPTAPAPAPVPVIQRDLPLSRSQMLFNILDAASRPMHYTVIHARAVEQYEATFTVQNAYQTMINNRDFKPLTDGVFALAQWRNRVHGEDRLRYCPPPPVPAKSRPETLFELIVQTYSWMKQGAYTYRDIWARIDQKSKSPVNAQDLFDLCYAVGISASIEYARAKDHLAKLSLMGDQDINVLRQHCLSHVMDRINAMPDVLAVAADYFRPTFDKLCETLYGDARDRSDLEYRLYLLEALGAVQSGEKNTWQVKEAGIALLEKYPSSREAAFDTLVIDVDEDNQWDDIGLLDL